MTDWYTYSDMNPCRIPIALFCATMLTVGCPTSGVAADDGAHQATPVQPGPDDLAATTGAAARDPAGAAAHEPVGAAAHEPAGAAAHEEDRRGTWTFVLENDAFAGTDRHYTNGIHLSWLSASDDVPGAARVAASWLPFLLDPEGKRRIGYNFGQSMFTPSDIEIREAQPDDRPWAGYLYGGIALLSETPRTLETLELDIGVVGPASFAEQAQKTWHELIGVSHPEGWNNQLKNEPTVALIYERKWREEIWQFAVPGSDFGIDVTPHVGAALGNVFTYASTGLGVRIGEDLPADFGPPRIRPSMPGSGFFELDDRFGWYFFASAEGRAVARNIFLDGNTFTDSASVDKLPFVADLQIGLAFMMRRARISVAQVYRTREFRTQNAPDRFGVISLSLKF